MTNDQVKPLNYCAHAIEDLRAYAASLRSAPQSVRAIRALIGLLQGSVKFILPNCGNLLDPNELKQSHLDLMRLPFPCVAFEVPWEKEGNASEYVGEFSITKASRRIALCWEVGSGLAPELGLDGALPEGGVFLVPVYWEPATTLWTVGMGGSFIPFNNTIERVELSHAIPTESRVAHAAQIEAGLVKANGLRFRAEPFPLLPEIFDRVVRSYGREKALASIILDTHDEAMVLVQACSVGSIQQKTTHQGQRTLLHLQSFAAH